MMITASEMAGRAIQAERMSYPIPKQVWDALDSVDHSHARAIFLSREDLCAERCSDMEEAAKLFKYLGYNVFQHKKRGSIIYGITVSWTDATKSKNNGKLLTSKRVTIRLDGSTLF